MNSSFRAVILAAGIGSRLGDLTRDRPKCLLPIKHNLTLIDYQIMSLSKVGISERDIFVIGGHRIDTLKEHLSGKDVNLVYNSRFREWNNIYSFYLIKEISELRGKGNFVLLNSDLFFHEDILDYLLAHSGKNCVVVDTSCSDLGWEKMKVSVEGDMVVRFGKDIPPDRAKGEYIGMAKFEMSSIGPFFEAMESLIREGKIDIWYEVAFNYALDKVYVGYVSSGDRPWVEIDTVEDYRFAQRLAGEL